MSMKLALNRAEMARESLIQAAEWLDAKGVYYREPLKTAVFSPSLTQAVRNPQICLFFVQFRLFLGFFVPHSSRIGPLQAHLGL